MKVLSWCVLVVLFFHGTEEQRTYKVKDECQCVPKNWDLNQVENLKELMMTWKTSFDYQMSGINVRVSNAMIKALMEVVKNMTNMFVNTDTNYNGTHYNSSGDHNMTDTTPKISTYLPPILTYLGLSPDNSMHQKIMNLVNNLENVSMASNQLNEGMKQLTSSLESLESLEMRLKNMNSTVQMLRMKVMDLEEKIDSNGKMCANPFLALAGNMSIETTITVSSLYGNNENKTISKDSLLVNSGGHWCANEPNLNEEFIQIKFNKTMKVAGLVVRGRGEYDQWISTYKVHVAWWNNGTMEWMPIKDEFNLDVKVFEGNNDNKGIKINYFPKLKMTNMIRFIPLTTLELKGGGFANKCTRLDVILCADGKNY